jgi:hypothetical protein
MTDRPGNKPILVIENLDYVIVRYLLPIKLCSATKSLHKSSSCSGGAISASGGVDSVAMLKKIRILFIIHSINRHCLCSFSHRGCVRVSYFFKIGYERYKWVYECLLLPHVGFGTVRLEEEATSNRGGEVVKGDDDGFSTSAVGDGDERGLLFLFVISEDMAAGFISVVTTS